MIEQPTIGHGIYFLVKAKLQAKFDTASNQFLREIEVDASIVRTVAQ